MIEISRYPTIKYDNIIYGPDEVKLQIDEFSTLFAKTKAQKVILLLENKVRIVCAMIAALKNQVCFIPVDCNLPEKRLEEILQEQCDALILTEGEYGKKIKNGGWRMVDLDSEENYLAIREDSCKKEQNEIAYIIYTSGSTGIPKGVMIDYPSLENLVKVLTKVLYKNIDNTVSFLNPAFDYFIAETLVPAILGMNIFLTTHEESINPRKAIGIVKDSNAEIAHFVPSYLLQLLAFDKELAFLKNIKTICLGGENFSRGILNQLQNGLDAKIYNLYGPTEGTVITTIANLTNSQVVHIGKAIDGVTVKLIGQDGKEKKEGELVICGKNVAKGYYHNDEGTKNSFVETVNCERCYLTGDYCRFNSDGNLEFLGRIDRQIKSLGNRIELDEIERCLECVIGVESAVVFAIEDNRKIIGMFVGDEVTVRDAKRHLEEHLPRYMIPNEIQKIRTIPVDRNGKKDYKRMKTLYENRNISDEELNWVIDLCKSKISDQIEDLDEEWSESHRIDSLSYVELIVEVEKKFNFRFPDNVLSERRINSIRQIFDSITEFGLRDKEKIDTDERYFK